MGRRPPLKKLAVPIESKQALAQIESKTNSLSQKKAVLEGETVTAKKVAIVETAKAKELKDTNSIAEEVLLARRHAIIDLDDEFKKKEARNAQYETEFQAKVDREQERIQSALPGLRKQEQELKTKIDTDLARVRGIDVTQTVMNTTVTTLKKEIEGLKKAKGALEPTLHQQRTDSFVLGNSIRAQEAILGNNKTRIGEQDITLHANAGAIEKHALAEKAFLEKEAQRQKDLKELDKKITAKTKELNDMNDTIIAVNRQAEKNKTFGISLEKKAQKLGVNIKLD